MSAFKRNLLIGYGLSLLLLLVSAGASLISITGLLNSGQMVAKTNEVIMKLESVISVLKDAETGARGFLLVNDDSFLEPYKGAEEKSLQLIREVKALTADNADQQVDCDLLRATTLRRMEALAKMINVKRRGGTVPDSLLFASKGIMDNARLLVSNMENREKTLLEQRTATMNRFSSSTPVLIGVASLLALLVTVISFMRVLKDYNKRAELQKSLEQKDEEISRRLVAVQTIADQIAAGDYKLKVSDESKDALGAISGSLNRMAQSLDESFANLKAREWLQTGIAQLNEQMIGEKNTEALTAKVIQFLTVHTAAQAGAFYLNKDDERLELAAATGLQPNRINTVIGWGEGIAGQCAQRRQVVLWNGLGEADVLISHAAGTVKPHAVVAVPVRYESRFKGVIELASVTPFSPVVQEFLTTASFNIGTAIHSARDHQRLQELLSETQSQSEELQAQQSELENINAELEAQAEKLQASEEELRVQQEELQQANQELEERSRLLEEKNELILERNFEIQRKAEELAISTKYKSEFLANMSHELRTPLNSILLLSRLLSENHEKNLSADQVDYANVIQSSGKGLLTLIDEILDLSKIESGKMELEIGEVKLDGLLAEIRGLFAPLAKDKGIAFDIRTEDNLPGVLETDRLRLEQILRNLLSNAVKFTRQGGVTLHVAHTGKALSFAVKDTGIGIPADKQQTIFEAFQQADGSTRRQYGGTGLGLSISRELAKLLGGEIHLKSEEGKGSEFTLVLPLKRSEPLAVSALPATAEQNRPVEKAQRPAGKEDSFLSEVIPAAVPDDRDAIGEGDKSILIIEDDTGFARSLLDYTRTKGYKGIVAVRGDEGIELARRFLPVGILLDVQLPVKNGWQVMEELKSDKTTRPIPVHMMSSLEVKNKSLAKGAVDFINKPVAFEKLGEMFVKIEQALTRHPKKVLIVEENPKHAQALAYFLESYRVAAEIKHSVGEGIQALNREEVDCVILDMGIPAKRSYDVLEEVKKTPGMENLPIIVFTGKNLSHVEERRIKQYADSIVVKTAHSYQRILDEISLFLHLVEAAEKDDKAGRGKRPSALGDVLRGKTVLVADDDVRNIFSLTKSLENHQMNVVSATDGKDALKQLTENGNVDLVLMDMMMPEMDGYESIRRIREMPAYRNLPIIAVTAKAMTGDREKCIAAGASDYITKPVDVDQLVSLLRVWLYG